MGKEGKSTCGTLGLAEVEDSFREAMKLKTHRHVVSLVMKNMHIRLRRWGSEYNVFLSVCYVCFLKTKYKHSFIFSFICSLNKYRSSALLKSMHWVLLPGEKKKRK